MPAAPLSIPDDRRYAITNAAFPASLLAVHPAAPGDLVSGDLVIADGRIERILPPGAASGLTVVDLAGGMVFPAFVDMHTHIDKGHTAPRQPNPDGTFASALAAVQVDREARWSATDVARRMEFSLACAWAHGTALVRTHIDSAPPQQSISWPVFGEIRERWAGRVDLQASSLVAVDSVIEPSFDDVVRMVVAHGGVLGAATFMGPLLEEGLDRLFRIAIEHELDLDFHVDETKDPTARSLRVVAESAIHYGYQGRVVVGHCCSLAMQPDDEADRTLDRVAEAGISVVSLPMCNMYLQDRQAGRTPRWRGVTLLHEMAARGIRVAVASDNTRDPFYAYGDLDMVEVFREAVRTLHLDHPLGGWPRVACAAPAEAIGRPDRGRIAEGGPADLVLFRARRWDEFLARPQSDRVVLRAGRAIDTTPPDYRELDDLMAPTAAATTGELVT
ncbi:MAG: cytosine deaminase [Bauldia sp.]|nr:cytosine deaminase [Bauldia sp.]